MNIFQKLAERPKANRTSIKLELHLNCVGIRMRQRADGSYTTEQSSEGVSNHLGMVRARNQEDGEEFLKNCPEGENSHNIVNNQKPQGENHLTLHSKYVISRHNKLKKFFDLFMDLLIYYSVVTALNMLGFFSKTQLIRDVDYFVWVMFVVDLILNFFTEFRTKNKESVRNLRMIATHYAEKWLVLDILALLPFSWVGMENTEYLLRLIRILKMKRLYDKINIYYIADILASIFYKTECRPKKKLRIKIYYAWSIVKELLKMIFVGYAIACLWLYYVRIVISHEHPKDDFLNDFMIEGQTQRNQFLKTWYFIFSTLMTVGYGDFHATNIYEMGFCIVLVIVGSAWFAFTMGKTIGLINEMRELSGIKDKTAQLNIWISNIEEKQAIFPKDLKVTIQTYFLHYWKNDRLGSICCLNRETEQYTSSVSDYFFQQLPTDIKNNILVYLFDDLFFKFSFFFKEFQQIQNEIVLCLQPRIYAEDSLILDYNSHPTELFLGNKGLLKVGYYLQGAYHQIAIISQGIIVGDLFALENTPSLFEFKAFTKTQGFSIPVYSFLKLVRGGGVSIADYLKYSSRIYSTYRDKIEVYERQANLDTDFKNDDDRLLEIDGKAAREHYCRLNTVTTETQGMSIKGIEMIKNSIWRMKEVRKKLLWDLKEKLINLRS